MSTDYPAQGAPLIEAREIKKSYGYRQILQGVNLSLQEGECVALKGENGAGKSTLLRILAGLANAESGSLHWRGQPLVRREPHVVSQIGYLGHEPCLHGALSLEQHLNFAACLYSLVEPHGRTRGLIRAAGLRASATRPIREFSRGMQQRGALCRLWLPDPRLLLLDEPGSHLDDEGLLFLETLIKQRQIASQAILLVTHREELASKWADRILYLRQGTLHHSADPTA